MLGGSWGFNSERFSTLCTGGGNDWFGGGGDSGGKVVGFYSVIFCYKQ